MTPIPLIELGPDSWPAEHIIAWDSSGAVTWSDWLGRVASTAAMPQLESGARWALFDTDSVGFSVGLFALWTRGCIPVVPPSNAAAVIHLLEPCVAGFVGEFAHGSALAVPGTAVHDAPTLRVPADRRLVSFTSGSTDEPKEVVRHVGQLDTEVAALEALWGERLGNAHMLASVSHQHFYGLLFKIVWSIACGRQFFARQLVEPNSLRALTEQTPRCAWISSPAMLRRLPAHILDALRADHISAIFSSGSLLPTAAAHRICAALGAPPIEVYGSTETGGVGYRQQWPQDALVAWRPLPNTRVACEADGRLLVQSSHQADAGWHPVGDVGELLDDGRFHLGRRADRIVKVEDKRVSLDAVEHALLGEPDAIDAACTLLHGSRDSIGAVVALSAAGYRRLYDLGRRPFIAALKHSMGQKVEPIASPRRYRFVDELPRNAQDKLTRASIDALFDAPDDMQVPPATVESRTTSSVRLHIVVDEHLACFGGHFPGSPVLPGAIQLLWAARFAADHLDCPEGWRGMEAVKFSRVIPPGNRIAIELTFNPDSNKLSFRYLRDGTVCSSGRLVR
jgi:acyl-CoA synthetase (AMP-forming)/AMP-acid ligase II/3-hydroxymyristoyl/3-hydroxydecanoyl-(acyl carrier protein) dehydratase